MAAVGNRVILTWAPKGGPHSGNGYRRIFEKGKALYFYVYTKRYGLRRLQQMLI